MMLSLTACSGGSDGDDEPQDDMNNHDMTSVEDMTAPNDLGSEEDSGMEDLGQDDADMSQGDMPDEADADMGTEEDADMSEGGEDFALIGQWASIYGLEAISQEMWGVYALVEFDNTARVAVTQNADDAEYFPGLYNRVVWTQPDAEGSVYYCTTDFGKDSADDALTDPTEADASAPEAGGCGGFPWTQLVPNDHIEVAGMFVSNFEGMEVISDMVWDFGYGTTNLLEFNNATNEVFTQNPDDAEYNPGLFGRIVWTAPEQDGSFYYCSSDFDRASLEEVKAEPTEVDDSMPESGGCGGFPWTRLMVTQ